MPYKSWNTFKDKHPRTPSFQCVVTSNLGRKGSTRFDANKKILPTPYALLREWLTLNIAGDWTIRKEAVKGRTFIELLLGDPADYPKLDAFGKRPPTQEERASGEYEFGYRDSLYADVARSLGYAV